MTTNNLESMIVNLIEKYNFTQFQEKLLEFKQEEIDVKIALLGEFSSGKTTLINSLIGKKLLPSFSEPTTAIITEILKGEENKCYILSIDELGQEVKKEISFGEIASEVTNADNNKKLVVELNDAELLNEGFKIIDTPGVSSIENMHEDITYGYLPLVDVVFMVMNIQSGTTPKSFLDFLKRVPKEQVTKMYFVLNFKDTIPPSQIESLKKSFEEGLASVIDSPNVILVSAKDALSGKLTNNLNIVEKSGVVRIEDIIKNDIVTYKREIEEKKLIRKYKDILMQINKLLRFKIENLDWSMEEDNKKIKEYGDDIKKIKGDIANIEKEFNSIKDDILNRSTEFINESVSSISYKIVKAEKENNELDLDSEIEAMVAGIEDIVNSGIGRIKSIKVDSISSDIGTMITCSVNREVSKIKDIADMVTNIATFVVTAIIVPGASAALEASEAAAGAAVVATQEASKKATKEVVKEAGKKVVKQTAKSAKLLKAMKFVGDTLKNINPLEKIKQYSLPYIVNPKLKSMLNIKITNSLECIFNELEEAIKEEITNNYLVEIKQKEEMVRNHINNKSSKINNNDQLKMEIEEDIKNIIKMM